MTIISNILVLLVAALHIGFLVLEMFFWRGPIGQRVFAITPEFAEQSAVLAANQGLYNGFLAAGLLWGVIAGRRDVKIFFLLCVIVAGVFGALTAQFTIIYTQAGPALAALAMVLLSKNAERGAG
ncbi:MAG: DUF1304 domain-containing protein [Phycisphaerales bacterium]|nr:DUF1304 domain-containing protein [Hyphomonadaceae bacterium]